MCTFASQRKVKCTLECKSSTQINLGLCCDSVRGALEDVGDFQRAGQTNRPDGGLKRAAVRILDQCLTDVDGWRRNRMIYSPDRSLS